MSKPIVKIIHNPVVAKILTNEKDVRHLCSEVLSYKIAGAEHMAMSSWDGCASLYKMKNDQFPAGMVRYVRKRLERAGYTVIVKSSQAPEPQGVQNPKVDSFPEDSRYDYQAETMNRLVSIKSMIAQIATGGGKSRIFKLCERRLSLPTLFLTTRKSLMYQMAEAYKQDLGLPVGILGDGHWSPIKGGTNFAIVDTLASRLQEFDAGKEIEARLHKHNEAKEKEISKTLKTLGLPTNLSAVSNDFVPEALKKQIKKIRAQIEAKYPLDEKQLEQEVLEKGRRQAIRRKETLETLKDIGFLCLEEAHEVSSDSFYTITQACVNAHYRLALTATPFMRDEEEANMKLMAATGPIGIKVSEKMLIERGILAKPYFKRISASKPEKLYRSTKWQKALTIGIVENADRNKKAVREVFRAKRYGLTSMLLVGRQTHGKILEKMLNQAGVKTRFIFGQHEQKERASALKALGNGEIECLIGSTILDVGVDVPSVGLVGLVGGGKAEVAIRQRIGRGLRAKKDGPNVCFVFDFTDEHNTTLRKHATERMRIIDSTPGFAEGVVEDFNYQGLGFTPANAA